MASFWVAKEAILLHKTLLFNILPAFAYGGFWLFYGYVFGRARHNSHVVQLLVLVLFVTLQGLYAYMLSDKYVWLQFHLNIVAMVFIIFQLSMLMGAEALKKTTLKDPVFIPNKVYRNLAITFLLLYIGSECFWESQISGFIAIGVGLVLFAKLKELHYVELLRQHDVQIYYLMQLLGGVGYVWMGYLQVIAK